MATDYIRLRTMSTPELLDELDRMLSGTGHGSLTPGPNVIGARHVAQVLRGRVELARRALERPHGSGQRGHGYELARLGLS